MQESFENFLNLKENNQLEMENPYFNKILYGFSFFLLSENNKRKLLSERAYDMKRIIIIDEYKRNNGKYIIICYEKTLIVIEEQEIDTNETLLNFLYQEKQSTIYFLKKEIYKEILEKIKHDEIHKYHIHSIDETFEQEIDSFLNEFQLQSQFYCLYWKIIRRSIAGFLIKKSYENTFIDRISKSKELFERTTKEVHLKEKNHFNLNTLKSSNQSNVQKIYHIEEQKLYIIKEFNDDERKKLIRRETNNLDKIHHPFIAQNYGQDKRGQNEGIIIEYIEGKTLERIKSMKLNIEEKIKIIFEIMIIINYLHSKEYIYRDLKPNNLIVNKNKIVVLIDFDRMIKNNKIENYDESTIIIHQYVSPEIAEGQPFSYSSDIYSLGMIIYYILFEEEFCLATFEQRNMNIPNKYFYIIKIINKCIKQNPNERLKISEIIKTFYIEIYSKISTGIFEINEIKNIQQNEYYPYFVYISEYQHPYSQYKLGSIYLKGIIFQHNINKAIHYYKLATKQNYSVAQYKLGIIYYEGKYIPIDIYINQFIIYH